MTVIEQKIRAARRDMVRPAKSRKPRPIVRELNGRATRKGQARTAEQKAKRAEAQRAYRERNKERINAKRQARRAYNRYLDSAKYLESQSRQAIRREYDAPRLDRDTAAIMLYMREHPQVTVAEAHRAVRHNGGYPPEWSMIGVDVDYNGERVYLAERAVQTRRVLAPKNLHLNYGDYEAYGLSVQDS